MLLAQRWHGLSRGAVGVALLRHATGVPSNFANVHGATCVSRASCLVTLYVPSASTCVCLSAAGPESSRTVIWGSIGAVFRRLGGLAQASSQPSSAASHPREMEMGAIQPGQQHLFPSQQQPLAPPPLPQLPPPRPPQQHPQQHPQQYLQQLPPLQQHLSQQIPLQHPMHQIPQHHLQHLSFATWSGTRARSRRRATPLFLAARWSPSCTGSLCPL